MTIVMTYLQRLMTGHRSVSKAMAGRASRRGCRKSHSLTHRGVEVIHANYLVAINERAPALRRSPPTKDSREIVFSLSVSLTPFLFLFSRVSLSLSLSFAYSLWVSEEGWKTRAALREVIKTVLSVTAPSLIIANYS